MSNLIANLDTILQISTPEAHSYYFYFEETGLYLTFPLLEQCYNNKYNYLRNYPIMELDKCKYEDEKMHVPYKPIYEKYFENMGKSKSRTFDNNYKSNQNKTIYFNNIFFDEFSKIALEFVMCNEFEDPITKGKGYSCVNSTYDDLIEPLDNINTKIKGYFFVSIIGYNNVLYYPNSNNTVKIPIEYIFNSDSNYTLDEKSDFYYTVKKTFSSNYKDYIGNRELEEVFVNGKNSSGQNFYINGELFNYSIYPILLSNIKGQKEHTFSIIYVYNNRILLGNLNQINTSLIIFKIIIEVLTLLLFGFGLLHIICLAFDILSKNILYLLKMLIIC